MIMFCVGVLEGRGGGYRLGRINLDVICQRFEVMEMSCLIVHIFQYSIVLLGFILGY